MQLSHAVHSATTAALSNSRAERSAQSRPGRRSHASSYLKQGYAARRRPMRFRIR